MTDPEAIDISEAIELPMDAGRFVLFAELALLGYTVAELTVAKYMHRASPRPSPTWRAFLTGRSACRPSSWSRLRRRSHADPGPIVVLAALRCWTTPVARAVPER